MKKIILIFTSLSVILISCGKEEEQVTERLFDVNVNMENDFINIAPTISQNNPHSGTYYSAIDSTKGYGGGYIKKIDDSLKGYNLDVYVSAWVREYAFPLQGIIALSLDNEKNEMKHWAQIQANQETFKLGEWNHVVDTVHFTNNQILNSDNLKTFSMKLVGSDYFDMDDLRIRYRFYK